MNKSPVSASVNGAWRFALVSLLAFAVWALPIKMKESVLFALTAVAFLVAGEIFLPGLVNPPNAWRKFNRSFVPAFVAYSVAWSGFWFALHSRAGEWAGLAGGCAVFALVLGKLLGAKNGFAAAALVLFLANAAGYFLGGYVSSIIWHRPPFLSGVDKKTVATLGKLAWGLFFGLGFGAGIGFAFHRFQVNVGNTAN